LYFLLIDIIDKIKLQRSWAYGLGGAD